MKYIVISLVFVGYSLLYVLSAQLYEDFVYIFGAFLTVGIASWFFLECPVLSDFKGLLDEANA